MGNESLKEILKKIENQLKELMYGDLLELSYGNLENGDVCFYYPLLGEGDNISIDVLYVTQIVCQALYDVCNILADEEDKVTVVSLHPANSDKTMLEIHSPGLSANTTDTRYFDSNSVLYKKVYNDLEQNKTDISFGMNDTLILKISSTQKLYSMMGYNNENPEYYKNAFSIIFLSQHVPGFP